MLLLDGATFAVQKTFFREDADPTEDREPARDVLALECALARHMGGVVPLPARLLELFDSCPWDEEWYEEIAYAKDAWFWWRDDSDVTPEEIWEAVFLDPPETFLGGHSGMTRTNLFRRSRSA